MSTTLNHISKPALHLNLSVMESFSFTPDRSIDDVVFVAESNESLPIASSLLQKEALLERVEWEDREFRQGYMESFVEQSIAWQINLNRTQRGLTQSRLAELIGTRQSVISRAENFEYGKHSLKMLLDLANAFDCALSVKFISYADLARVSRSLTEDSLIAESFDDDMKLLRQI